MRYEFAAITGRRIEGIVIKARGEGPATQLFLVFDDGHHFEFYWHASRFFMVQPAEAVAAHTRVFAGPGADRRNASYSLLVRLLLYETREESPPDLPFGLLDAAVGARVVGVIHGGSEDDRFELAIMLDTGVYVDLVSDRELGGCKGLDLGGRSQVLAYMPDAPIIYQAFDSRVLTAPGVN